MLVYAGKLFIRARSLLRGAHKTLGAAALRRSPSVRRNTPLQTALLRVFRAIPSVPVMSLWCFVMRPTLYYIPSVCFSRKPSPASTCVPRTVCLMTPCPSKTSWIGTFSRAFQSFKGDSAEANHSKSKILNWYPISSWLQCQPVRLKRCILLLVICVFQISWSPFESRKVGDERTDLALNHHFWSMFFFS